MTGGSMAGYGRNRRIVRAYVVFQDHDRHPFWRPFTRPGFRHCWVMLPAPCPAHGLLAVTYTMKIEALAWGVDTAVWWAAPDQVAAHFARDEGVTVVGAKVQLPPPDFNHRRSSWRSLRGFITCVSIVKAALGLRGFAVTPHQLFQQLVAAGGEVLEV